MKFQLIGPWATNVGQVPAGTILDSEDWRWHGMPLPLPPPPNAAVMEQEGWDEMRKFYSPQQILIAGENINRW